MSTPEKQPKREFIVTLRIKTYEGGPSTWDWSELLDEEDVDLQDVEEVNGP